MISKQNHIFTKLPFEIEKSIYQDYLPSPEMLKQINRKNKLMKAIPHIPNYKLWCDSYNWYTPSEGIYRCWIEECVKPFNFKHCSYDSTLACLRLLFNRYVPVDLDWKADLYHEEYWSTLQTTDLNDLQVLDIGYGTPYMFITPYYEWRLLFDSLKYQKELVDKNKELVDKNKELVDKNKELVKELNLIRNKLHNQQNNETK